MLIAGDGRTHIYKKNSLEYNKWDERIKGDLKRENMIEEGNTKNLNFDIVMTNPPFAGEIKERHIIQSYSDILEIETHAIKYNELRKKLKNNNIEKENREILIDKLKKMNKEKKYSFNTEEDYEEVFDIIEDFRDEFVDGDFKVEFEDCFRKKRKNSNDYNEVERHILFIQRALDMLKPGGRTAIVLPQGVLDNTDNNYIRQYIMEKARVLAVIGLHVNSFKPHTGAKTSIVFLRKWDEEDLNNRKSDQLDDYPIFFAVSKVPFKDNSGNYIYLRDEDGNILFDEQGNPYYKTDLFDIADSFIEWGCKQLESGDETFKFLEGVRR